MAGANIRALRLSRGWSLARLAGCLNVTRGAVSHWELGRNPVPLNQAQRIAGAFGVPLAAILPLDNKDAA